MRFQIVLEWYIMFYRRVRNAKIFKGEIPSTSRMVYYVLQGCWEMPNILKGEIPSTSRMVYYVS